MNDTARDIFVTLAAGHRGVVWLDSAMPHDSLGRTSIISAAPELVLQIDRAGHATLTAANGVELLRSSRDPFVLLDELTRDTLEDAPMDGLGGGWIGWLGYDIKNRVEPRLPPPREDETGLPAAWFGFYPSWWIIDHTTGVSRVAACNLRGHVVGHHIDSAVHAAMLDHTSRRARAQLPGALPAMPPPVSDFGSREQYETTIARAIEYVHAGDIFQANIAQRFRVPFNGSLVALYLALRTANPAPFAACLLVDAHRGVLSSSPERLLRIDGDRLESRPIKGTRERRANDDAGNATRIAELLASEKDHAELAMIVDLVRNDLGKVSAPGSVRVTADAALEEYATVYHLVSTVESQRRADATIGDCLRAAFPGGSISGAPKFRAMEIIDELEPVARGVYTGSIGYITHGGRADFNIAIRTMSAGNGCVTFHAGGGIVADSRPADEYDETLAKARGLIAALSTGSAGSAGGG
ncbi:MAG: anthranilate synthase component I family protein [Planctomycetota bacterium]